MTKQENDTYSENRTYCNRDVEMIYAGIWQASVFGFSSTTDGKQPEPMSKYYLFIYSTWTIFLLPLQTMTSLSQTDRIKCLKQT